MHIRLKFFAGVRETLGVADETLDVPAGVATIADLRAHLAARGGAWAEALGPERVLRTACDHVMSAPATPLAEGCEIAFFPPMTGG